MKVLLLGDYSGFHYNLAKGLRALGIQVTVASEGDGWKGIPRDVDLKQPDKYRRIAFLHKLYKIYPNLIGYDVVQMISHNFLMSSPFLSSIYFDFLKRKNDKIFVCATGMDYTYVNYALKGKLKHSVFYHPNIQCDPYISSIKQLANNKQLAKLERKISKSCDGIIATSNGYYEAYNNTFPTKTIFIPLPIDTSEYKYINTVGLDITKVKVFVGLMKDRVLIKGIDKILDVLLDLEKKYPNDIEVTQVHSVPFNEYTNLLNNSHILCDQLYSSGVGINGLIAMAKGLIVGGCGDDQLYESLGEFNNRPIIDLNTSKNEMFHTFEQILENKSQLKMRALKSREFVVKHHDCIKVAQKYLDFWKSKSI